MPLSPKSGRKRELRAGPLLRDPVTSDKSMRTCAQCAAKVARHDCHRNRYGQYICSACLAKLRPLIQPPPIPAGGPTLHFPEMGADESPSRRKRRRNPTSAPARRLLRKKSSAGQNDIRDRMLQVSVNVLIMLFLMGVFWLIWTQA